MKSTWSQPIGKQEFCFVGLIRRGFVIFFHFSGYDEIVTRVQTGPFFARPPPFDIKKSQQCRIVALPAAKSWKFAGRLPARQSALPNFCQAENLAMTKVKGNLLAPAT